ncbi:MAG: endonuclease III [Thermoplasmata archaeon]|nr:endonuclease III [Thermoplasmata archaeon]
MTALQPMDWGAVLDRLSAQYGRGDWRVPYLRDHAEDPFQVLIGTILSQRTRDEATDRASALLFARFPDPRSLARAKPREIVPLIRACGFYHVKATVLPACARAILERFGGVVPRDLESLLSLPGVGPKTANCVLVFGYGIPAMPVDTHVHRIANRLGVVKTEAPEATELALRRVVPERYWIPINPLLVQHGQNLCRPIGPRCELCPIWSWCATGVALRAGRAPPREADRPRHGRMRASTRTVAKRSVRRVPRSRRRKSI